MFRDYLKELSTSNPGWDSGYPDWRFSSFFSVPAQDKIRNITSVRPRPLPDKSFSWILLFTGHTFRSIIPRVGTTCLAHVTGQSRASLL